MSNTFPELGFFLVDLFLSLIVLVFTLRILLALNNASTQNPITQSIIIFSRPFRSIFFFLPNIGKFELSSFILIVICHFINIYMQNVILGSDVILEKLIILSFKSAIFSLLNVLIIIFIILAISSWFIQFSYSNKNPALDLIHQIANPILYYIKKIIPTSVGVIDFSVVIALVLIHFLKSFLNIII